TMAMALGDAYVLQSASSNLYQLADEIGRGFRYNGSALFSICTGAAVATQVLPPYLVSASAMQSRAFPAFTYDPAAGTDWAARFSVSSNPQVESTWPVDSFLYEDAENQRHSEDLAFTLVDLAACDERYADHFVPVAQEEWHDGLVPVGEYLQLAREQAREKKAYILCVDDGDLLQKALPSDTLIESARRCSEAWRSLQELAGINNSHALSLLEREKKLWEEQKQKELDELRSQLQKDAGQKVVAEVAVAGAPEAKVAEEPAEVEEERPPGEPYIETTRCNSCNECTNQNKLMFVYNENKQAYIADPAAGTYRDLVIAAEKCQVAIIHPGKPRNPDEPNLEDLLKRAEPFQ
ncbi:hypothetical protein ACFL59_07845, partial [Planctomycetota bacterium]